MRIQIQEQSTERENLKRTHSCRGKRERDAVLFFFFKYNSFLFFCFDARHAHILPKKKSYDALNSGCDYLTKWQEKHEGAMLRILCLSDGKNKNKKKKKLPAKDLKIVRGERGE